MQKNRSVNQSTEEPTEISDGKHREKSRIGYACVTVAVPETALRTCTSRFATEKNLREIIAHNLDALYNQCAYNIAHRILLFRISSDIVPFAGTPVNTLDWEVIFNEKFRRIGERIRSSGMRVSMHPGQYTVLNSPDPRVVENAVSDLEWHGRFLDALNVSQENKIILHVGGVYGDKSAAMNRFSENFRRLSAGTRSRVVIENDERSFSVTDVLGLHDEIGVPVVYDNLHREVFEGRFTEPDPGNQMVYPAETHREMIIRCRKTWSKTDGRQKIHYSQQDTGKRAGAHSETIRSAEFMRFYDTIRDIAPDIMLEVKDKNLSAVKCVLLTEENSVIKSLEEEWSRYKYLIMERSPENYTGIRKLFAENKVIRPIDFYALAEDAMDRAEDPGRSENAALHVWGYFSGKVTESEKRGFFKRLDAYRDGRAALSGVKSYLFRLAGRYGETYLLNSLYFYL